MISEDIANILSEHGNLKPNQLTEGVLFVTPEQWELIVEREPFLINPFFGCFVSLITKDSIIRLPSGRVLMYSKALDSFNVFDREVARATGMIT